MEIPYTGTFWQVINTNDITSVHEYYLPLDVSFFIFAVLNVGPFGRKSPTNDRVTEKLPIILKGVG